VAARRVTSHALARAGWDLLLLATLLSAGPLAVSAGIALTPSRVPFLDCVFPGPLVLWSPAVVAALALPFAVSRRGLRAA
jgi:hypothetical protein